jgi:hypothetical protein
MKEYIKGEHKYIVIKNEKGLYDYQSQELVNGNWINMSKQKNFTRVALENWLEIEINF